MTEPTELGEKIGLTVRIREKNWLSVRIRDNFFSMTLGCVHFKVSIFINENAVVLNLKIMIEFDPLYKNVSDTSPLSLSENMKNKVFS